MSNQSQGLESKEAAAENNSSGASVTNSGLSTGERLEEKENGVVTGEATGEPDYATGLRLILIMITISISGLLTALEIGIIATAIPEITDKYHSINDVGWYGSATFLLAAASSAMWGKMYKYMNVKHVYLASMVFFLVGSVVAAAAPSSSAVIVGRALQGFGASGTMGGSIIVINYVAHPQRHPLLIGIWMSIFMVSTILGPVVGGALTSGVSWRWCFWINLPLGGPITVLLYFALYVPKHIKSIPATWKEIILQLDFPGFAMLLASLVCLALALQRGGQTKAWDDASVIATLVLWIVFTAGFVVVEWFQDSRAIFPLELLKPRMTWANALYNFISNSAFYQMIFYLPIYFQSIHGQSAITSGVNTLPFLAFFAVGALSSGGIVMKTRYLQPYQLASALVMTAGMALIYTFDINTPKARYIGAEILFGIGLGFGNQIPLTAVQGLSKPEDITSSTGIIFTCQSGSAAYFILIAQSIFANRMLHELRAIAPNLIPGQVLAVGASDIHKVFTGEELNLVLRSYMAGIKDVFAFALAGSAAAVLLSFIVPFKRLPNHDKKKIDGEGGEENSKNTGSI